MNETEIYSATLSLALIELENFNVLIDDFQSLLEDVANVLDYIFKDADRKPVSTDVVKDYIMKKLTNYENSLNNIENIKNKYANKLKPFLVNYHENRDLYFNITKQIETKIIKYKTKIKEYQDQCIKYLNENGIDIYNSVEFKSNNGTNFNL